MLLYGHYLYGVVAVGGDARKHLLAELVVGAHSLFVFGHAYVALVDEQRRDVGPEIRNLEFIWMPGGVDLRGENFGFRILHHVCGVCRDAFPDAPFPLHAHLVEVAVMDGVGGDVHLPGAVFEAREAELLQVFPVGEITYEPDVGGVGGIFAEHPSVGVAVQPVVLVGVGEVHERAAGVACEFFQFLFCVRVASLYRCGEGFEPRVVA